jgi:hypothetical protein
MKRLLILVTPLMLGAAESGPEQVAFFEKNVRPVLVNRCYGCHSAETKPAGFLRVDDRNGLLKGGDSGPAVVPGQPEKSLLLQRIRHADPKKRMPKEGGAVTDAELASLTRWIADGAAWPREAVPSFIGRVRPSFEKLKTTHWALQPLHPAKVPAVRNAAWPANDVDRFLLATLEAKNLKPVGDAGRVVLARRVTFDLTGLPPTPAEIDAFVADRSPNAYAALVDRLLASPRFGERWGRHWLDVARYGESSGPSRNMPYPHAWRYRDYVIDAVNRDVPFDRFIQEQVAGDLLPAATSAERDRLLIATGFLALGVKDVNQRFKERFQMDNVDEQIDTVSRSVLGLTVTCARCHDHKFDPIPMTDYYALAGIFTSTVNAAGLRNKMGGAGLDYYDPKLLVRLASQMPEPPADQLGPLEARVLAAKKKWDGIRGTPEGLKLAADGKPAQRPFRLEYERLQGELLALTDPGARGYAVHGVREDAAPGDTEVRIRGEAERLGPVVPRGFLTAFAVPGAPSVNPKQSGRLELAQWLTHPRNPLTPRVAVNRAWQHLFGQGIVATTDNFGVNGDQPSHAGLLDHLAAQFVRDGWSVKRLVRTLVLSRAYRLSADAPAACREVDPANRLVWRHAPRRMESEEVRDAMLAAAGRLDLAPEQGSAAQHFKMIELRDDGPEAYAIHQHADRSVKRSVYLPLLRGLTPRSLEAFDPVTQTLVTGQRDATTVPGQALFLLNSAFVRRQALALAEKLLEEKGQSTASRIRMAYRRTLGRTPTQAEIARAARFVADYELSRGPGAIAVAAKAAPAPPPDLPVDQEDDRGSVAVPDEEVAPVDAKTAAWMALAQALYASAEFRFVR